MGQLVYPRGTTFTLTHIYQKNGSPSNDGATLLFTVKTEQSDTDTSDTTAVTKQTVAMSGSTTVLTIEPDDIADTYDPGTYYYDIKIIETGGAIYVADSGTFKLTASPTNRLA